MTKHNILLAGQYNALVEQNKQLQQENKALKEIIVKLKRERDCFLQQSDIPTMVKQMVNVKCEIKT